MLAGSDLIAERRKRGWTQEQAAALLGVSQAYLSLLEAGRRPVTPRLFDRLRRLYVLGPLSMPFLKKADPNPALIPADLGGLGCPGFIHLLPRRWLNPGQLLLIALRQPRLPPKVAEALPWVAVEYAGLNWPDLVDRVKLVDCQNRLGFVVTLAKQLATHRQAGEVAWRLGQIEGVLENSRLVQEDTLGLVNISEKKLEWLRDNRSDAARRWNVLSELRIEDLKQYVAPEYH